MIEQNIINILNIMPILSIKNLHKKYGDNHVLKWVDLEVQAGDFFALLWHNGAGKTTLISILTNLVNKTDWEVKINNVNIDEDFSEARKYIGVVPQEFNFDVFAKVIDIIIFQAGYYWINKKTALKRAELYLKKLDLWNKRNSKAKELSGWMKRRLMIARALVHNPKILILDEPTAGVDVNLRKTMWEFVTELNNSGTTIILTTHYLEEVEALCKNVAILNDGNIVKNTSVKKLLSELEKENIILTYSNEKINLTKDFIEKFSVKMIADNEIELEVTKEYSLNELFEELTSQWVTIRSFRNKTNRLETLFIKLSQK